MIAPWPGALGRDAWEELLSRVHDGATAVIGPLRPEDELATSMLAKHGVAVNLHFGIGNWMGCYHWVPASDLFAGLPANRLAEEAYVDVLPHYVTSELGGQVFAGSFLGRGMLCFCQYRIFDKADSNPLAGRLLSNLLGVTKAFPGSD